MSPSAVSQIIRALELQGGVTLLHRSTRKLALTEAGERYYPHCKRMVEAARAAADSLQLARGAPSGELRVSAPVGFAAQIGPALAPLLAEAPQLRLRLLVDDAMIDLIDARIDLAVRVGRLADSNWVARRLCDFETILCASADYLSRRGTPALPQHLVMHQWLALGRESTRAKFQPSIALLDFQSAEANSSVYRSKRASPAITKHLCEHGLGIARLSYADVQPTLERGALVRVLPEWSLAALPVWAVTPNLEESEAAKVRAAVHYLRCHFAKPRVPL